MVGLLAVCVDCLLLEWNCKSHRFVVVPLRGRWCVLLSCWLRARANLTHTRARRRAFTKWSEDKFLPLFVWLLGSHSHYVCLVLAPPRTLRGRRLHTCALNDVAIGDTPCLVRKHCVQVSPAPAAGPSQDSWAQCREWDRTRHVNRTGAGARLQRWWRAS